MEKEYTIDDCAFTNYEEYKQYVKEEWEFGAINELEEDGLIIPLPETISENGTRTVENRILTEEEFNVKYNGK